jgi:hypothetical protein
MNYAPIHSMSKEKSWAEAVDLGEPWLVSIKAINISSKNGVLANWCDFDPKMILLN